MTDKSLIARLRIGTMGLPSALELEAADALEAAHKPPAGMPEQPLALLAFRNEPDHDGRRKVADYADALREWAKGLSKQLPGNMQNCTIRFKECAQGHGWLTADNWVQHPCQVCRAESAEQRAAAAERDAERYRWLALHVAIALAFAGGTWFSAGMNKPITDPMRRLLQDLLENR